MRTGRVIIPSAWDTDWIPLSTAKYGHVNGPVWKQLSEDEKTGASTYLCHYPPGWHDDLLDWHPAAEENFCLAGKVTVGKKEWENGYDELTARVYGYRPPGILHGPAMFPDDEGGTILHRMAGPLFINRYTGPEGPEDPPAIHKTPITDEYKDWPTKWTESHPTDPIPWEETTSGGWAGTKHKWVWRFDATGGGVIMFDVPAGWSGSGSPARGSLEEFVVEGSYTAGGNDFGKWGYSHREPGDAAGTYSTETGVKLVCWWDEADELVA